LKVRRFWEWKMTASVSSATTVSSKRVGRGVRWSPAEEQRLLALVKAASTVKAGLDGAALEFGRSRGTLQQKYYALERAAGRGRTKRRAKSSPRKATRAAVRHAKPAKQAVNARSAELRGLDVDELVQLAQGVKAEVDRRRAELDRASELFG